MAGYDLSRNKVYAHSTRRKGRTQFLSFCRYLRSLHPAGARLGIVLDNFSSHLSTRTDPRVGAWAANPPRPPGVAGPL
jgi:hypothetical protein